jgi:Transmembrane amino acid transporter protein
MKKASMVAVFITTFFYLCCGCFGYAAFGDETPGNLLTGFGFYEPYWLIDFANVCIVIHLVGGYQVGHYSFFFHLSAEIVDIDLRICYETRYYCVRTHHHSVLAWFYCHNTF